MQSFGLIWNNFGVSASSVAPDFPFKIVSSLFDTRLICFLVFTKNKSDVTNFYLLFRPRFSNDVDQRSFFKVSDRLSDILEQTRDRPFFWLVNRPINPVRAHFEPKFTWFNVKITILYMNYAKNWRFQHWSEFSPRIGPDRVSRTVN